MIKRIVLSISCLVISIFVCGVSEAYAVTCQKGYVAYNGACYRRIACKNGGTQQADKCKCTAGWKGNLCQTAKTCSYTTTKCVTGYKATGKTCQSGNNKYIQCKANECKGYDYTKCPTGYAQSSSCMSGKTKKLRCGKCASGYTKYDGKCYKKLYCKNGGTQQADKCQCTAGWKGNLCQTAKTCSYTTTKCVTGYKATGKTCQSGNNKYIQCKANECKGYDYTKCPTGYVQSASCMSGKTKKLKCERKLTNPDNGKAIIKKKLTDKNVITYTYKDKWTYSEAANNANVDIVTDSKSAVTGVLTQQAYADNAFSHKEKKNATISIEQRGNGTIYGMRIGKNIYNLDGDDPDDVYYAEAMNASADVNNAYADISGQANGKIKIANKGTGNVYGIYSDTNNGIGNVYLSNAYADVEGKAVGNIEIVNSGKGNVYGMSVKNSKESFSESVNAIADEKANARGEIKITNSGGGNVYGMHSDRFVQNAVSYITNEENKAEAKGVVNIINSGSGNVYAMKAGEEVQNAKGAASATGIVRVENSGSGKAYGLFSKQVDNAVEFKDVGYIATKYPAKSIGKVQMLNKGKGSAYGLFSNSSGNKISNISAKNVSSLVEMTNTGDGLVTGIYSKNGAIQNSGNIKLHNLGNGTAIGIYADGNTIVTNSGNIIIDRANYVDGKATDAKSDDVTYTAKSATGGKAIGIYGAKGSSITNTGTIKINGAKTAYGIFSEGYGVRNTGNILIDGKNTENAVRLNGGKLFQDGVMVVDAKWNDKGVQGDIKKVCVNGTVQGTKCICKAGWEGTACQTAKKCAYSTTKCGTGYFVAESCQGGNTKYVKCQANACSGYVKSCGAGYTATADICQSGSTKMYKCQANACSGYAKSCGAGYTATADTCQSGSTKMYKCQANACSGYAKSCGAGYTATADTCQSGSTKMYKCQANACVGYYQSCPKNYHATSDTCLSGDKMMYKCETDLTDVDTGTTIVKKTLSADDERLIWEGDDGEQEFIAINNENLNAVVDSGNDVIGLLSARKETANVFANQDEENVTVSVEQRGYGNAYGIKINTRENAEAYNVLGVETGELSSNLIVINKGNGNTYGMYSNAGMAPYGDPTFANIWADQSSNAYGAIRITDNGLGNVYGILRDSLQSADAHNALADESAQATGEIQITKHGQGDVYGVVGAYETSNARVYAQDEIQYLSRAHGELNITQTGDGNIYGLKSEDYAVNAGNSRGADATGNIRIDKDGDGDIYGIYGAQEALNAQVVEPYYGYASSADASININHNGSGDVYGIKSSKTAANASGDYATGSIRIYKRGAGNIYGIVGKEVNNAKVWNGGLMPSEGIVTIINDGSRDAYGLYSDTAYNVINNSRTDKVSSVITMINRQNGLVVGIYSKQGTVNNSGDIEIHNLGDGMAVGIYADADADVYNTGNITINRSDYIDVKALKDQAESNVYMANSLTGGKAIGIYGAAGSYINNSGTITINDTPDAYGIYSSGGSVWNTGTININKAECVGTECRPNTRAIHLNGGKLLQNGKIVVGTDFNHPGCADGYLEFNGICYEDRNCGEGSYQQENNCVCSKGYTQSNGYRCFAILACEDNKHQEEDSCVCDGGYIEQGGKCYAMLFCDDNATQQGNECVCNEGYIKQNDVCYEKLDCNHGTQNGNTCDCEEGYEARPEGCYQTLSCPENSHQYKDECLCDSGYMRINDICQRVGQNEVTNNKTITITNTKDVDVYGMYGGNNNQIYNAYSASKNGGTEKGIINIRNDGNGKVYGMYSQKASNAASTGTAHAQGEINITNTGNGQTYGMSGWGDIINSQSSSPSSLYGAFSVATISISNRGNGMVYGIYGMNGDAYNAYIDALGTAQGTLSILNEGNADVYGMYGNSLYNAYTKQYGTAKGIINITNKGTGTAYGMHGFIVYNAYTYYSNKVAEGSINVVNIDRGRAFGMYGSNLNNNGNNNKVATIEMANIGGGLVVGMYSKDGKIKNFGDIKIHNLGDGFAVGILADGTTNVTNSGNITIDRVTYTDPQTGQNYKTTSSENNSSAIGIYGANGSTITNSGKIIINGAGKSYGIFAETGSLVENTGTIRIDDSSNHSNAIHLEGGQLFQDGVLQVSTLLICGHGHQEGDSCVCQEGWHGTDCNTPNECAGSTDCGAGYDREQICLSGDTPYYACTPKEVPAGYTSAECGEGFVAQGAFISGEDEYHECVPQDCFGQGYHLQACPSSAQSCDECLSGNQRTYKITACGAGLELNEAGTACLQDTCSGLNYAKACGSMQYQSGTCEKNGISYAVCADRHIIEQCAEYDLHTDRCAECSVGYMLNANGYCEKENTCDGYDYVVSCPEGMTVADTCQSGETVKYKCELNDCSEYQESCGEGYDAVESCLSGTIQYYTCTEKEVPAGYTASECGNGYTQRDTFISGTTPYYLCEANTCEGFEYISCPAGYAPSETCQAGETLKYKCEKESIDSAEMLVGSISRVNDADVVLNNTQNRNVYGMKQSEEDQGYMINSENAAANISIENQGSGNVYGMYGKNIGNTHNNGTLNADGKIEIATEDADNVYGIYGIEMAENANASGWVDLSYTEDGRIFAGDIQIGGDMSLTLNGTIKINSTNSKNVYGMYSGTQFYNAVGQYLNESPMIEVYGNGLIDITNIGDGNIYGMYNSNLSGDDYPYNSCNAVYYATAEIRIHNEGDGQIYGMYASRNGLVSNSSSATAVGRINVDNDGDGNVYGMYAGNVVNASGGNASVRIKNKGNGDVYGLYAVGGSARNKGGWLSSERAIVNIDVSRIGGTLDPEFGDVYGIYADYSATNADSGQGIIRIINFGDSNVYGIKATDVNNGLQSADSVGKVTVINRGDRNSYGLYGINVRNHSKEEINQYSIVEMVNLGSGLTVGMYAKDGRIENSGEIKIHNLSDGTAIGIYADGDTEVNNIGLIVIDRESYVDHKNIDTSSDDETYTAKPDIGGKAIGIYGAAGAEIENSGIIRIMGASTAYGIWSEGTDVENEGIIEIDGEYNENAIRLQGGTLFQNGTIYVQADWSQIGEDGRELEDVDWDDYIINNTVIRDNKASAEAVIGMNVSDKNGINAYAGTEDNTGVIEVTQGGSGDVYGMRGHVSNPHAEDEEDYDDWEIMNAATNSQYTATGTIRVINTGDGSGEVFGMYTDSRDMYITNATYGESNATDETRAIGTIEISNSSNKNVYGIYSGEEGVNAEADEVGHSEGIITITNNGDGDVYGIHSYDAAYNSDATEASSSKGTVTINNIGNGDVYGLYSTRSRIFNSAAGHDRGLGQTKDTAVTNGFINIENVGNGDVYGIKGVKEQDWDKVVYNARSAYNSTATGRIRIRNNGLKNAYGIRGTMLYNTYVSGKSDDYNPQATGRIDMINHGSGRAYGLYGWRVYNESDQNQTSSIEMTNVSGGLAVGIYADASATNSGDIIIHNLGDGTAVGIMADGSATVTNSGTITIDREVYTDDMGTEDKNDDVPYSAKSTIGGKAIGIYGTADSSITNSGTITINGASEAYGIYSEGTHVVNTGTINIDGTSCVGADCNGMKHAIELNGGKLFQNGVLYVESEPLETQSAGSVAMPKMSTTSTTAASSYVPQRKAASLNLDDFGGTVVASNTSQFIVEGAISGDLAMNNSIIENGFDTTYTVAGMIDAEDTSGLRLISQSALFDATLENNRDAVMTMKSFNDVVANQSLADFLKQNYATENNEELFGMLKGQETIAALNSTLDSITGSEVFNRFNFEDMTMMRELNMDVNNKLFNDKQDYLTTSGTIAPFYFDSENGADGKYALYNHRIGKKSFGLSLAFANINSSDRKDNNQRNDESFQMSVPFGYNTHGFKFITAPRFGYAYGHYDRDGFESRTYKGTMEKRMFGLMNEARYPIAAGKWSIAPAVEFNMLGYHLKGSEDAQEYSLNINGQNNYSVESGIGLYANREMKPTKDSTLKLNAGIAVYHEFADPYTMELGMHNMNGSFKIRDERRKDNRAVVRTGFDYSMGDITLEGNFATFVDGTTHNNVSLDFRYNF